MKNTVLRILIIIALLSFIFVYIFSDGSIENNRPFYLIIFVTLLILSVTLFFKQRKNN